MAYLLLQKLQNENKKLKIRISSNAHSGAIIGEGSDKRDASLNGEIPRTNPTILGQIDLAQGKESIDLVLVNGGINDVDVANILNPATTPAWLRTTCKKMCHDRMTVLLNKILNAYPEKTNIIVTGYYQIVSNLTSLNPALILLLSLSEPIITQAVLNRIIENCAVFATEANSQLKLTVDEVAKANGKRIAFANPNFGAKNAVLVPLTSYLYGLTPLGNPEDPMAEERKEVCPKAKGLVDFDHTKCLRASAGHPNPKGEMQYANQIFKVFTDNWSIPQ